MATERYTWAAFKTLEVFAGKPKHQIDVGKNQKTIMLIYYITGEME